MSTFFGPEEQRLLDEQRASPEYLSRELTPDELAVIEKKRAALAELFKIEKIKANHKIEFTFGHERSTNRHFPGSVIILRSGSALSGGGDEPYYPCPDDRCVGFLPPKLISSMLGFGVCPKCRKRWPQNVLKEQRLYRLYPQSWARVAARYFIRLNSDADIYLKYHPVDIRKQTALEQEKDWGGEKLNAARAKRVRVLYPLHRIYTDLKHGADLEKRFLAFLVS